MLLNKICISNERQHEEKYFDKKILNLILVLKAKGFLNLDLDVIRFSLKLKEILIHLVMLTSKDSYHGKNHHAFVLGGIN